MLARHAEVLYWAGRYLERTEATVRMLDVSSRTTMHLYPEAAEDEWSLLVAALGMSDDYEARGLEPTQERAVRYLFADGTNPGSVRSGVRILRENLRVVRDRIPVELWEEANQLYLEVQAATGEVHRHHAMVREGCQTLAGIVTESMPRDEGEAFFVVGRMLERAILTGQLLDEWFSRRPDGGDLSVLLRATSSLQAFRRTYGYSTEPTDVIGFLLQAESLPRSVLFCLRRAEQRLATIDGRAELNRPQQLLGRIRSRIEYADIGEVAAGGLLDQVTDLESRLRATSEAVSIHYFRPHEDVSLHAQYVLPGGGG